MKRKLGILAILLAILVLAAATSSAEAQAKSWDVNNEKIYSIQCTRDMVVIEDGGVDVIGTFKLLDATFELGNELKGVWSVTRVDGDEVEIEVASDGGPSGELKFVKGADGEYGEFDLTFVSDGLINPVSMRIYVYVISSEYPHPTDYVYPKTEHEAKTGTWIYIDGGKALPEGIEENFFIRVELQGTGSLPEGSHLGADSDSGAIYGYITQPGVYKVTARAYLMDNLYKDTVHTITVTGTPQEDYIPDFMLMNNEFDLSMLEVEDAQKDVFLCNVSLFDNTGRANDEFAFDFKQTKGETINAVAEKVTPWDYKIVVKGGLKAGEYVFEATLSDTTREESDMCTINVTVNEQQDGLPEGIKYAGIKDETTVTAGKTLKFKAPKFEKNGKNIPDNHYYYLAIDNISQELYDMMVEEDTYNGKHEIKAIELGEYDVRVGLSMYDDTRMTEYKFKLIVEPGKGAAAESISIVQKGDKEKPYEIVAGSKTKLKVNFTPKNVKNKAVIWTSSEPYSVSVSDKGVLSIYDYPCQVEIRATAADGSGVSDTTILSILPPKATKLAFNKKKATMQVGSYMELKVKYTPKNLPYDCRIVSWSSDNSEVAEVDSYGFVTAKAPGKAVIYAFAIDAYDETSLLIKDVYAKCIVTVK